MILKYTFHPKNILSISYHFLTFWLPLLSKSSEIRGKTSIRSSNGYEYPKHVMISSTEKEELLNTDGDAYDDSKHYLINIQHQDDDENKNGNTIDNVRREVNIYPSTNERIQDSTTSHKKNRGYVRKATGKRIHNNKKESEDKAHTDVGKIYDSKVILNASVEYDYSNIQLDGNHGTFNNEGKRTSSVFVTNNVKNQHINNRGAHRSSLSSLVDNTQTLSKNILKVLYREKRFSRLDERISNENPTRYIHLNDDVVGGNIVEEDLLPFYRPTKYFLSPQLSFEQDTQSTEDENPSGKLRTSTITINDVEPSYFASIASRNRRTTEAAGSSSFILNKEDDRNIDESDLSTMLTSQKTKRSKKTTPQTFQLMEVDDDDRSPSVEKEIYKSINDRRPVLNLRSIDDQEDRGKTSNSENDLLVTRKSSRNDKTSLDDTEEEGVTTTEDSFDATHQNTYNASYDISKKNRTRVEINGTFVYLDESNVMLDSDEEEESVTPNPLDYLDITDDDLNIKGTLEDEVKQRKLVMISKILKDVEQQALQGANCTPGTGLNMGDIDLVGNNYKRFRGAAEVAVNRANWLTRMWKYASDVMKSSEYLLHSSLFSMIESNEMIFGAGNCYDGLQYKNYSLFCPFAYKSPVVQGHVLAKDLAVEYKYLKPSSTWFWTPKQHGGAMAKNLPRFETGKTLQHILFEMHNNAVKSI